jgi:Na+/melibiose symporter-like transporter
VLIARIPAKRRPSEKAAGRQSRRQQLTRLRREWAEGLSIAAQHRTLSIIVIFLAAASVGEGIMGTLFAPFVRSVLHGSSQIYGYIVSAQAVGGVAGGLIAASIGHRIPAYRLFAWGAVAFGAIDLLLFLYPLVWVTAVPAIVVMTVVGLPGALMIAGVLTLVQCHTSDTRRGRVSRSGDRDYPGTSDTRRRLPDRRPRRGHGASPRARLSALSVRSANVQLGYPIECHAIG